MIKLTQRIHQFFQSRLAVQSFLILLLGTLLIVLASNSLFAFYLDVARRHPTAEQLPVMVSQLVSEAKSAPDPLQKHKEPKLPHDPAIHVKVSPKPLLDAALITTPSVAAVRRFVRQHHNESTFAVRLDAARWLNIRFHKEDNFWSVAGLAAAALVLLFALIFLCAWGVKRLALPFRLFAEAAKRFGIDVQAPPLAVTGAPEMQEAIQAYNEMQSRIRRLLHDRTQMLAAISHDLRTPITRLQLRAEYLKEAGQYEKAVADLAEMDHMISSILSFARDYVNTEQMENVDMGVLLESICDDSLDMGHKVVFSSEGRVIYFGRIAALKRALSNLIDNAIKYGQEAKVVLKQADGVLQIKVTDQGPGIAESQLEKVFEPFYRVDSSRSPQTSGTGLGLAVARDIVRAHGGEIRLLNQQPCGLTVVVTLPLV